MDDGSTQDPINEAVVQSWAGPLRVRILRHQINRGIPSARNTGVHAAKGEWIAFLDQDDEWVQDKLERQIQALLSGAPVVFGSIWYEEAPGHYTMRPTVQVAETFSQESDPVRRCGLLLERGCFVPLITLILHRDCFDTVGFFDETLRGGSDDYDFVLRLSLSFDFMFVNTAPVAVHHLSEHHHSNVEQFYNDDRLIFRKLTTVTPELRRFRYRFDSRLLLSIGLHKVHKGKSIQGLGMVLCAFLKRPSRFLKWLFKRVRRFLLEIR